MAQELNSLLYFVHLRSGDVYVAMDYAKQDQQVVFTELNLGRVVKKTDEVKFVETIFPSTKLRISLGGATQYTGFIQEVTASGCRMKLISEELLEFNWNQLGEIELLEDGGERINNPNSTRYFFAPSAFPLDKGTGYYQNAYILSNSANFGVSNRLTIGGGVIIPLLFYVTPKISWKIGEKFYAGAGMIAATTVIPDFIVSGGIPYAIATYGNRENNLTIAGGYALLWTDGEYQKLDKPIITINGMVRLSNRVHLVSENWFIPYKGKEEYVITPSYQDSLGNYIPEVYGERDFKENYLALSVGLRVKTGKNSSFDITPVYIKGTRNNGIVIPYLDFVMKF